VANPQKSLILTYHRVTDDDAVSQYYDVPVSSFRDHVARVAKLKSDMEIVFTFDDGTKDHPRVAEILAEHGLKGIFFLVWGRLGQPGYIAREEVGSLVRQGQIIGSHTMTHRLLPTLGDAELNQELTDSRDRLANLAGSAIEWFAPPGGHYDNRSPRAAREAGYRFFRTMDWGYAPPLQFVDAQRPLPTVPILRNMSARRLEDVFHGRARFPGFIVKQLARRILPEYIYYRLRSWAMAAKR